MVSISPRESSGVQTGGTTPRNGAVRDMVRLQLIGTPIRGLSGYPDRDVRRKMSYV